MSLLTTLLQQIDSILQRPSTQHVLVVPCFYEPGLACADTTWQHLVEHVTKIPKLQKGVQHLPTPEPGSTEDLAISVASMLMAWLQDRSTSQRDSRMNAQHVGKLPAARFFPASDLAPMAAMASSRGLKSFGERAKHMSSSGQPGPPSSAFPPNVLYLRCLAFANGIIIGSSWFLQETFPKTSSPELTNALVSQGCWSFLVTDY